MRELEVLAAAVNVDHALAELLADHHYAFGMPARSSSSPGRIPLNALVGLLPQGEVQGVLLLAVFLDAGTDLQLIDALMGQLAILVVGVNGEVDVAVDFIGRPFLDQPGDEGDDLIHGPGHSGRGVQRNDVELGTDVVVGVDVGLGNGILIDAVLDGLVDDLVVNIGEIGYICYLIAAGFQHSSERVEDDDGTGVADMGVVVDRRSADVHADFTFLNGFEFLNLQAVSVIEFHNKTS